MVLHGKQSGVSIPVLRWRFQLNNFNVGFFVYKTQRFRTDTCATGAGGYLGILDLYSAGGGHQAVPGPMVLDRLRFFRCITWSLLKDSGHWYLRACLFRFTVVHCKTKRGISQNQGVKNWGPCCLRQFFKCSNRKSAVLDQDPSLFFQAIDKAGAFGVSTLFGLLAPNWWRTHCDVGHTNQKESAVYQLWITYLFWYIVRRCKKKHQFFQKNVNTTNAFPCSSQYAGLCQSVCCLHVFFSLSSKYRHWGWASSL